MIERIVTNYMIKCRHCKREFIAHNPSRVYCNAKCRMDFNNVKYKNEGTRRIPKVPLNCKNPDCKRLFFGRKGTKFCHKSCREAAYIRPNKRISQG